MKLHLACGPHIIPNWINIDIDHELAEVHADLTQGLQYENQSVDYIFSEHFIEHLPRKLGVEFLKECRRVLKIGGVIRLSTPSLDEIVDTYVSNDYKRWGDLWQPINRCHLMNEVFYNWGHQFLYNKEELILLAEEAGFEIITWCDHRLSAHEALNNLEARPFHNELIVELTNAYE